MSAPKPEIRINLMLAIEEHAVAKARELETEADALEARARDLRREAKGYRETYAAASPYFPKDKPTGLRLESTG